MEKKHKEINTERLLSPSLKPVSISSDSASTKRRQWNSGPPINTGSMRYRTGRVLTPIPPPSPSASSTPSKDIFPDRSFDNINPPTGIITLPNPKMHLNPLWPNTVINLIKKSTSDSDPRRGDPSTIRRVPREFHKGLDGPCSPRVICIGPYFRSHRNSSSLKYMQDNKWRCVESLVSRYDGLSEPEKTVILTQRCTVLMKAVDAQVRQAYADSISMDDEELAEMMVLDGCFLLHLLLRHAPSRTMKEESLKELEHPLDRPWVWNMVTYDLLLVENQIPFFVVEILFDVFRTKRDENVDLVACMLNLFTEIHPHGIHDISLFRIRTQRYHHHHHHINHFLHAYYLSLLPEINRKEYSSSVAPPLLSALESTITLTKLLEKGITVTGNKNSNSFIDIRFKNGILNIPTLQIHDCSVRQFRNLVAYERCGHENTGYVSGYLSFMRGLTTDPCAMETLCSNGVIIDKRSGDEFGRDFFGKFEDVVSVGIDESYMKGIYWELIRYECHGLKNEDCNGTKWTDCVRRQFGSLAVGFSMGALVMFLLVRSQLHKSICADQMTNTR